MGPAIVLVLRFALHNPYSASEPYPTSWPFFSSMITSFAIALSVSNTPVPSTAQASKSGRPLGLSAFFISSSGTTFCKSRLLYWMT